MSERALKQLVGALVIVVGVWLLASFLSRGSGAIRASGDIVDFFAGIDPDSLQVVRLGGGAGSVELRRVGSAWQADGFRADSATVARLMDSLRRMEVGDLVATNPANHQRMGVSADSALTFEVEVGGQKRTLLVGNQGPRFGTSYGRLPGEDDVYLLEGDLRVQVRRPLNDWRNKNIARVDTSRVARVEVERDGDAYTVVRGDSVWTLEGGGEADATQVRNILTELSTVLAAGFLTEADSVYALPRGGSNVAYAADGQVLADITLGSGEGERWARAAGDSVVYRLSTFRVGRLAPTLEAIRGGS